MIKIGIIGGGFCGMMTATRLVESAAIPLEIYIIEPNPEIGKGIAYQSYSDQHLLNVIASKMSAYEELPNHFLDWVMTKEPYKNEDRELLSRAFLPRNLYGAYLSTIWKNTIQLAESKEINLQIIQNFVKDIDIKKNNIIIFTDSNQEIAVDYGILATGNLLPRNPKIKNNNFYAEKNNYHQNPWGLQSVKDSKKEKKILIIGNGLTMVDTVFGLIEQGFSGKIYSLSPNGFHLLPHRGNGIVYTKLLEEISEELTLNDLAKTIIKHIRIVRKYGLSAEPVIDSLRPITQKLWISFSESQKKNFLSRFRYLWNIARHRIPLHSHDKIQQYRTSGNLQPITGAIVDFNSKGNEIEITYFDKKQKKEQQLLVDRVINCTGPETDFSKLENSFIKNKIQEEFLAQDSMKLGLKSDFANFNLQNKNCENYPHFFSVGNLMKGELWESTAVGDIRIHPKKISEYILTQILEHA